MKCPKCGYLPRDLLRPRRLIDRLGRADLHEVLDSYARCLHRHFVLLDMPGRANAKRAAAKMVEEYYRFLAPLWAVCSEHSNSRALLDGLRDEVRKENDIRRQEGMGVTP